MKFTPLELEGLILVETDVHRDDRGFFLESYHAAKFAEHGISATFVQDNHSRSGRHTLRGLHAQTRHPQAKLVRVVAGEIWDVVVDIRRGSPTFGRHQAVVLSAENFRQLFVPIGFAHGFCVLSEFADVVYKSSDFYDPIGELRLRWNEPAVAIPWPVRSPILSEKDRLGAALADVMDELTVFASA
jgi:dTDP-4-dehydrorhamnose 3,5-epimerase